MKLRCAALAALLAAPHAVSAHDSDHHHHHDQTEAHAGHDHARPDSHAPIGVMGDHLHAKGEWMFSYRRMLMEMEGNRSGTSGLFEAQVLQQFMVTPTRMSMTMDMFGVMVGTSDEATLMLSIPRIQLGMDHLTRAGGRFRTESEGVGDIRFGVLGRLSRRPGRSLHYGATLSFPTGNVEVFDATPMGPRSLLPYPMRLGAGTYGFHPSLTYTAQEGWGSFGFQLSASTWLGNNDQGYQLGDALGLQGWVARKLDERWSTSLRLAFADQDNISGFDSRLNQALIPTARPDLRAGKRLDLGLGVNFLAREGHRLALEYVVPVRQDLDGPQLETDRVITLGYQFAW